MSKKREILGHISLNSGAEVVNQVLTMMGAIVTRHLLGPYSMGIWATLNLVLEYAGYSVLGISQATVREIPYYVGKKEEEKAAEVKNLTASFALLTSGIAGVGILGFAVLKRNDLSPVMFWGLISISTLVILQRWNNTMVSVLRAYKRFDHISYLMVASAIVKLALIFILSSRFGLYGFMTAMVLSGIFNIAYLAKVYDFKFHFVMNHKIKALIQFGVPLMLLGFVGAIFKSVDKMIIVKLLGYKAMGFYSIAVMVIGYLNRIPLIIGGILLPHFQEIYGVRDSVLDVKNYVDKAVFGLLRTMLLMIGLVWIVAPLLVEVFLPQFREGIPAVKWLCLSSLFLSLAIPYADFISLTLKKYFLLFPIMGVCIALAAGLNVTAIRLGWGIEGVSVMTAIAYFVYFLLVFAVSRRFFYSYSEAFSILKQVLFHFIYSVTVLLLLDNLFGTFSPVWLGTLTKLAMFGIAEIPLIYSLNKNLGLWNEIKGLLLKPQKV